MFVNPIKIFNFNNYIDDSRRKSTKEKYSVGHFPEQNYLITGFNNTVSFSGLPYIPVYKKNMSNFTMTQGATGTICLLPKHIANRISHRFPEYFTQGYNLKMFEEMISRLNNHEALNHTDIAQLLAYLKYVLPQGKVIKLKKDLLKAFDVQEEKLISENNEFITGKSRLEKLEYMLKHPDFLTVDREDDMNEAVSMVFRRKALMKKSDTPRKKYTRKKIPQTESVDIEYTPEQLWELYQKKLSYSSLEKETGLRSYKISNMLRRYFMEQADKLPELSAMVNIRAQEFLEKLPFDKEVYNIEKISNWIKENPKLLITNNLDEMKRKITYLANAFAENGLTEEKFADICFECPRLLFTNPRKIENSIKMMCKKYGFDISYYLQKCKTNARFLRINPDSTDAIMSQLVKYLKTNGYIDEMPEDFDIDKRILDAFKKEPELFYGNANRMFENINQLHTNLEKFNITKEECLLAYLSQPSLFEILPDRIYDNMMTVCEHFHYDADNTRKHIKSCINVLSFLYRSPFAVIDLINALMYTNGNVPDRLPTYSLEHLYMEKFVCNQFKKTHEKLIPDLKRLSANRHYTNKQGEYIMEYYRNHPNETLTLFLPDRPGYYDCVNTLSNYSINNTRPLDNQGQLGRNIFNFEKFNFEDDVIQKYVVSPFCHVAHISTKKSRQDIVAAKNVLINYYKKHPKSVLKINIPSNDSEYIIETLENFSINNLGRSIFEFKI